MSAHLIDPQNPYLFENKADMILDVVYASLTSCEPRALVQFFIERKGKRHLFELVYIGNGASHSWWTASGGKFFPPEFPHGLEPGDILIIETTAPVAFRIDWYQ